jgi:hypothetical protein
LAALNGERAASDDGRHSGRLVVDFGAFDRRLPEIVGPASRQIRRG